MLIGKVEDENVSEDTRRVATLALVKNDPEMSRDMFRKHIDSGEPHILDDAILVMEKFKELEVYDQVADYWDHPSPRVRFNVAYYFEELGGDSAMEVLEKMQYDEDDNVRRAALGALRKLEK